MMTSATQTLLIVYTCIFSGPFIISILNQFAKLFDSKELSLSPAWYASFCTAVSSFGIYAFFFSGIRKSYSMFNNPAYFDNNVYNLTYVLIFLLFFLFIGIYFITFFISLYVIGVYRKKSDCVKKTHSSSASVPQYSPEAFKWIRICKVIILFGLISILLSSACMALNIFTYKPKIVKDTKVSNVLVHDNTKYYLTLKGHEFWGFDGDGPYASYLMMNIESDKGIQQKQIYHDKDITEEELLKDIKDKHQLSFNKSNQIIIFEDEKYDRGLFFIKDGLFLSGGEDTDLKALAKYFVIDESIILKDTIVSNILEKDGTKYFLTIRGKVSKQWKNRNLTYYLIMNVKIGNEVIQKELFDDDWATGEDVINKLKNKYIISFDDKKQDIIIQYRQKELRAFSLDRTTFHRKR